MEDLTIGNSIQESEIDHLQFHNHKKIEWNLKSFPYSSWGVLNNLINSQILYVWTITIKESIIYVDSERHDLVYGLVINDFQHPQHLSYSILHWQHSSFLAPTTSKLFNFANGLTWRSSQMMLHPLHYQRCFKSSSRNGIHMSMFSVASGICTKRRQGSLEIIFSTTTCPI